MNKNVATIRVRIEHVANGIKRCMIVKDKFRSWLRGFADTVMEIACALHNFRLRFRPWQKVNADCLKNRYSTYFNPFFIRANF